jgi:hypothetical protein
MGQWHGMIDNSKSRSRMERGRLAAAAGCYSEEMAITRKAANRSKARSVDLRTDNEVLTTNQNYPVCSGPSANTSAAKESC